MPLLLYDGTNYYLYDNTGTPLAQISTTGTTTWLHHDQLGTTRLLTNTSGATVGTATYDPYGKKTTTTGTVSTPLGFNGQYTDTETALIYLRARYYDPTTAQFLTIDPLIDTTRQPYAYAANTPLDATDPTGLACEGALGCFGAHALSALEGFNANITFGLSETITEAISPGATCTYAHDGYFKGGEAAGEVAGYFLPGGIPRKIAGRAIRGAAKTESRVLSKVDDLPCNCFVAGTKVKTADGKKPIEDIEIGDKVWARDLDTGTNELRTITGLFHKHADRVMTITVADDAKVTVTKEHPFYVAGLGWVTSGDLKIGDKLAQRNGGSIAITAIEVRPADTTVYNFTVEGDHNYYVTEAQLLVHNCGLIPGNPFRGPSAPRDAFAHLERYSGLDPKVASNRLHVIKRDGGLGAADDVVIGRTGDVYDGRTGELLDSLTNPGLGTTR